MAAVLIGFGLTENLVAILPVPAGAYLESEGIVAIEAERGRALSRTGQTWLTATGRSGYTGTAYLILAFQKC